MPQEKDSPSLRRHAKGGMRSEEAEMKTLRSNTPKVQDRLRNPIGASMVERQVKHEDLRGKLMKRQLDFAEIVSSGRAKLTRNFVKTA